MRLIIAGGRRYRLKAEDYRFLDSIEDVTEVLSGKASGADRCGEEWAKRKKIPVRLFPPDWKAFGKRAGPMRNAEMSLHADAVVLFPGGKGTASMAEEAEKAGLQIFDRRHPFLDQRVQ
jgi:hypothetical protein